MPSACPPAGLPLGWHEQAVVRGMSGSVSGMRAGGSSFREGLLLLHWVLGTVLAGQAHVASGTYWSDDGITLLNLPPPGSTPGPSQEGVQASPKMGGSGEQRRSRDEGGPLGTCFGAGGWAGPRILPVVGHEQPEVADVGGIFGQDDVAGELAG